MLFLCVGLLVGLNNLVRRAGLSRHTWISRNAADDLKYSSTRAVLGTSVFVGMLPISTVSVSTSQCSKLWPWAPETHGSVMALRTHDMATPASDLPHIAAR
ncbi:hypothetical protein BC629DRAFT_1493519 [Irpex lacteus]|nr:hypothetical protein BC629DRAFT_1493519 [Irpex lacteus]